MIRILSVPMIGAGFVSCFFFFFYLILSLRTKVMEKQNGSYLIFSILTLVNMVYVISFAVFINSAADTRVLSFFNRLTIMFSMYVILLALHFNKHFFGIPGKTDLIIFYILNGIFSLISFWEHPLFLSNELLPSNNYYTGLKFGPLFQIWDLYVVSMMLYSMALLFRQYFIQKKDKQKLNRVKPYLLLATLLWNIIGILDALSGIRLIQLPPLTWLGSLVMILSIEVSLVTKIENLYIKVHNLYQQVIYDSATNAFSKSYFELELERSIKDLNSKNSYENEFCYLILVDIDDFKNINDKYGHLCGDYVLKRIAEIMKNNLRRPDLVARYGGDEFIILMENSGDNQAAVRIIERLRQEINQERFRFNDFLFSITCSFGITPFDKSYIDNKLGKEQIISRADSALYLSKRAGKNRVHIL